MNMTPRKLEKNLSLSLLSEQHAPSLFELTDKNRAFLRPWFPWVEFTIQVKDTVNFINEQQKLYGEKKAIQVAIERENTIIGVVDYHEIDLENDVGRVGYWLGEQYNGNGYMSLAVMEMLKIGFNDFALNRIEIQCAKENVKSRAIPERIGFIQEGILRSSEKVNGQYYDHVVYGLLKSEAVL